MSTPPDARGTVVGLVIDAGAHASVHERHTLGGFVRQLAALRGAHDGGVLAAPAPDLQRPLYFVPTNTLHARQASQLGITCAADLYGGIVPHAFLATKAISHPLVDADAARPHGWAPELAHELGDAVLDGYTAFELPDAVRAGRLLLALGAVRLKAVRATGGHGQTVVRDERALRETLDAADPREVRDHGIVLEHNLQQVSTYSVGQVHVGELVASYVGTQRLTRNNRDQEVFGGSDLMVARGGFDALLALPLQAVQREAIERARRYDAAVRACHPGLHISRGNYDVVHGLDAGHAWRCAVLEQSWRAGGATGAEIAALAHFVRHPHARWARAACWEIFGDCDDPPADATVYWRGDDPHAGPLTKYTRLLHSDVDARQFD